VHRFVQRWADVAAATLGRERLVRPYQLTILDKDAGGKPAKGSRKAWHIDTSHYKDLLSRLIHTDPEDPSQWHLYDSPPDDYFSQMCSEHKTVVRSKTSMKTREVWLPVQPNAPNHYWDCEVYAAAASDMLQVRLMREDDQPVVYRPAAMGDGDEGKRQKENGKTEPPPMRRDDGENWLPDNQDW